MVDVVEVLGVPILAPRDGREVVEDRWAEGVSHEEGGAVRDLHEDLALPDVLRRVQSCLLYTSPSPRDQRGSRMPSSA